MKRREGRAGGLQELPTEFPQAGTPADPSVLPEIQRGGDGGWDDNRL